VRDAATAEHLAGLVTPAAVRLVDLDDPPADLELRSRRRRIGYRSLLAVARLDGEPVGAVAVPVGARGHVPGDWLAEVLRYELGPQLHGASARPGATRCRRRGSRARRTPVSVVVTGSHDPMLLERCLRSIFACDDPDFEVIVVEQRPASHDIARLLDARFDGERRLHRVENAGAGVSRARNAGLAVATGELVMFADGDVVVDAHWISRCRAAFDDDRDVVCVTGLILPPQLENDGQLLCDRFASATTGFHRKAFRLPDSRTTHPFCYYTPGSMGSGANTALRADIARELGGFDAALGPGTPSLGGEDVDLYGRLLVAGHTVAYDPSVIVWQEHHDGAAQLRRDVLRQGISMGAALAKQLATSSERRRLLRALPAGLRYELDLGAAHGAAERPRGLDWRQRLGLALGPPAYAASVLRCASRRAASRRTRTPATRADRVLIASVTALCLLVPLLVVVGAPSGFRFAGVLALLCLAPGTALVIGLGHHGPTAEPGLLLGASLGAAAVLAQTMLWLGAWWPKAFLCLLAMTCLVPLLARCRELVPRRPARGPDDIRDAPDDERREASEPWVTDVELAGPLSDLRPPSDPSRPRNGRARVLARLHGQPIGFVEVPLRHDTVAARDLAAAIDAKLSTAVAAHLARDGLQPGRLTPKGLPCVESPPCAAPGFYGESEPFVSVILSASNGNGAGPLEPSLQAVLGVNYRAYEVVVARAGCSDESYSRELRHPRLRYVYEPLPDPWEARRRAVRAADGDILAFTDTDVVVDANWVRALVDGLAPAAGVGCVTGPVLAPHGAADGTGVNFAVSRDALLGIGGFDGMRTPARTGGGADDALIPRFLLAGWAVSHEPGATAWRLPAPGRGTAAVLASVANRLAHSAPVPKLGQWLGHRRDAARRSLPRPVVLHAGVLAAAGAAWVLSLGGADLSRMGGLGLLQAMPATYFIAVGLLLVGFTATLSRDDLSNRVVWLYALALILVLHGTTAVLYDEPRYAWTYKHLGVIALIDHARAVDRSVDIYNNWPGFFALAAWLSAVTGVSAISYAAWAQVFFNLANVVALRFALRGLTSDERVLWTASLFFVLGNWVSQDYLAPQAFAFVLSLVVLGLCLRCTQSAAPPKSRASRWWIGVLDRLQAAVRDRGPTVEPRLAAPLPPGPAIVVGGLCYLAIVVSHQLTPVIVLASTIALALIARRIPLWVPLAMALVEAWWLWRSWPYLSEHFHFLDPTPSSTRAPAGYRAGDGLPGLALVAYAIRVEILIFVALAAVAFVRRLRKGHWDLAPVTLIAAPFAVVALQAYGGEGRGRGYLFALPWLCFFAAAAVAPTRARLRTLTHRALLPLVSLCLGTCLLFAYFGLELMNRIDPDDVAAAAWFERHAPTDSVFAGVAANFPRRLTARYAAVYDPAYPGTLPLTDHAAFRGHRLGVADLPRIEKMLRGYGAPHTFLTLSGSQERYVRLYGLLPAGSLQSLEGALRTSPDFRLVYRRGESSIFEYRPRREPRAKGIR
jgi:GT2 family glycosyltransferase